MAEVEIHVLAKPCQVSCLYLSLFLKVSAPMDDDSAPKAQPKAMLIEVAKLK